MNDGFGFEVTSRKRIDVPEPGQGGIEVTEWTVSLPHQCDRWEIACGTHPSLVAAQLREFIREAQAALADLLAQPTNGHEHLESWDVSSLCGPASYYCAACGGIYRKRP